MPLSLNDRSEVVIAEIAIETFDNKWQRNYHSTMKITIDKAGRVVIPKKIRERYHLQPGTELEIENEADGFSIKVRGTQPSLIRKGGILVHHGSDTVTLDIAEYINQEREYHNIEIADEFAAENPAE